MQNRSDWILAWLVIHHLCCYWCHGSLRLDPYYWTASLTWDSISPRSQKLRLHGSSVSCVYALTLIYWGPPDDEAASCLLTWVSSAASPPRRANRHCFSCCSHFWIILHCGRRLQRSTQHYGQNLLPHKYLRQAVTCLYQQRIQRDMRLRPRFPQFFFLELFLLILICVYSIFGQQGCVDFNFWT